MALGNWSCFSNPVAGTNSIGGPAEIFVTASCVFTSMSCWDFCMQSPWLLISVLLCDRGALWAHKPAQSCLKTEEFFWSYCFLRSWNILSSACPFLAWIVAFDQVQKRIETKTFCLPFSSRQPISPKCTISVAPSADPPSSWQCARDRAEPFVTAPEAFTFQWKSLLCLHQWWCPVGAEPLGARPR